MKLFTGSKTGDQVLAAIGLTGAVVAESGLTTAGPMETALLLGMAATAGASAIIEEGREKSRENAENLRREQL